MKKLILLFLSMINLQLIFRAGEVDFSLMSIATAQRMYQETGDNCKINSWWYQVGDLCANDEGASPLRCDYCGLYFMSADIRNAHQGGCNHRPHIEYLYDDAGNRIERVIENYRLGRKVSAYNNCIPFGRGTDMTKSAGCLALFKKEEDGDESQTPEKIA